jgi:hypothetical protein
MQARMFFVIRCLPLNGQLNATEDLLSPVHFRRQQENGKIFSTKKKNDSSIHIN